MPWSDDPQRAQRRRDLSCSFCGKRGDQVQLICGPTPDIAICSECVELCREILDEQSSGEPVDKPGRDA